MESKREEIIQEAESAMLKIIQLIPIYTESNPMYLGDLSKALVTLQDIATHF